MIQNRTPNFEAQIRVIGRTANVIIDWADTATVRHFRSCLLLLLANCDERLSK